MSQESDGIEEALQGVSQVMLTGAARVGEQVAREIERRARQAKARSEQAAAEMAERLKAERETARASLSSVYRPEWWDAAEAKDIADAYTTARAWRDVDPQAAHAQQRILAEVRERYGVEVPDDSDRATFREAVYRGTGTEEEKDQEHSATAEKSEAAALIATADAADRAAEDERATGDEEMEAALKKVRDAEDRFGDNPYRSPQENDRLVAARDEAQNELDALVKSRTGTASAEPAYDSRERREQTARSLEGIGDETAVEARVTADVAQARPATEATHPTKNPPRARRSRRTGEPQREVQQGR